MRRKAGAHAREQDDPHAQGLHRFGGVALFSCLQDTLTQLPGHLRTLRSRSRSCSWWVALALPRSRVMRREKLTLSAGYDARMMVPVRTRARTRRLPEDSGRLGKLAGWVANLVGVSGAQVGSADASRMPTRQVTRTVQAPIARYSIRCPPADKWRQKSPLIACGGIVPCDLHTASP